MEWVVSTLDELRLCLLEMTFERRSSSSDSDLCTCSGSAGPDGPSCRFRKGVRVSSRLH